MLKISTNNYPIFCGTDSLVEFPSFLESLKPSAVFIVTDRNSQRNSLPLFLIDADADAYPVCILNAGEENKKWLSCERIFSFLISHQADRTAVLVNLGGGVVTDTGGFSASVYKRGIRYINIPTTLLAMVDASVGGKTGIDFQGIKNVLGTFTHPEGVFISPTFLHSLPNEELISGFGEMVKHAFIAGGKNWERISELKNLSAERNDWTSLISESVSVKKKIVEEDFKERSIRKVLNFGHTIGHALESYFMAENAPITHGEAIMLGMIAESFISCRMTGMSESDLTKLTELVKRHFPNRYQLPHPKELYRFLANDKKSVNGKAGCYLFKAIGKPDGMYFPEPAILDESVEYISKVIS